MCAHDAWTNRKQEERDNSTGNVAEGSGQTMADHLDRVEATQAPAPAAAGPSTAPEPAFDRDLSNAEVAEKASVLGSTSFTEEEVALIRDKPSTHQPWEIREVLKHSLMRYRKAAVKEAKEKEAKRRRDEAEAGASKRVKS